MAFILLSKIVFIFLSFCTGNSPSGKVIRVSKQATKRATPFVSAVLLECPKAGGQTCHRQMMVNIRVSASYQVEKMEKYLILDEVYDQGRRAKARIMSPYLIEISRGEPVVMYPLEFTKNVRCSTCGHKNISKNVDSFGGSNCPHNGMFAMESSQRQEDEQFDDEDDPGRIASKDDPQISAGDSISINAQRQENIEYLNEDLMDSESVRTQKDTSSDDVQFYDDYPDDDVRQNNHDQSAALHDSHKHSNRNYNKHSDGSRDERLKSGLVARKDERHNPTRLRFGKKPSEVSGSREFAFWKRREAKKTNKDENLGKDEDMQSTIPRKLDKDGRASCPLGHCGSGVMLAKNNSPYGRDGNNAEPNPYEVDKYAKHSSLSSGTGMSSSSLLGSAYEAMPYDSNNNLARDNGVFQLDSNFNRKESNAPDTSAMNIMLKDYTRNNNDNGNFPASMMAPNQVSWGEPALGTGNEAAKSLTRPLSYPASFSSSSSSSSFASIEPNEENNNNKNNYDGIDKIYEDGNYFAHNQMNSFDRFNVRNNFKDDLYLEKVPAADKTYSINEGKVSSVPLADAPDAEDYDEESSYDNSIESRLNRKPSFTNKHNENENYLDENSNFDQEPEMTNEQFRRYFQRQDYDLSKRGAIDNKMRSNHAQFMPKQPPFSKIISDPNLSVNDKIGVIDSMVPQHQPHNQKVTSSSLDGKKIARLKLDSPSVRNLDMSKKRNLRKRSYVLYDDLTMRDTDDYDDGGWMMPFGDSESGCKSCGGHKTNNKVPVHSAGCDCEDCLGMEMEEAEKPTRSVSDVWYSVFNMSAPLQFLTTQVRIFRKRAHSWWRIAPSITLTSLSGIYANENLSIMFSSHVDIFQLNKPLMLKNHKLLVPNEEDSASSRSKDIIAIDENKLNSGSIMHRTANGNDIQLLSPELANEIGQLTESSNRNRKRSINPGLMSLADFGEFPASTDVLERCPNNSNHLCLNMLADEVPSYSIRIKFPFLENALIFDDDYKVRITNVITDATTRGALLVTVAVVNEGFMAHEFIVFVHDCPVTCGGKSSVQRKLHPHIAVALNFLLPLEEAKDKKYSCHVEVETLGGKVIARRKMIVEPTARCMCIWQCNCYCIPKLASSFVPNVCHILSESQEVEAGFRSKSAGMADGVSFAHVRLGVFFIMLIALIFGLLKGIIGLALVKVDKYGYDYLQPMHRYWNASRARRFFINVLFFMVIPFVFWCKCFTPSEEDLLTASAEWRYALVQEEYSDEDKKGGSGGGHGSDVFGTNDEDDDEETILSQRLSRIKSEQRLQGGGGASSTVEELLLEYCNEEEEEEENDIRYILKVLAESRESLKKHCSDELDTSNPQHEEANNLVKSLAAARIVCRTFRAPLGNVTVPDGQNYSIRGCFVPSLGPGYQFFTYEPCFQYWTVAANDNCELIAVQPPNLLSHSVFARSYKNKMEIWESGDLSVHPPNDAPYVNVLVQNPYTGHVLRSPRSLPDETGEVEEDELEHESVEEQDEAGPVDRNEPIEDLTTPH